MTDAELILYATPSGPLAEALDDLYAHLAGDGRSTAQDYPPHCTLTGFFHRDAAEIPRIAGELGAAVADRDHTVGDGVDVVALHRGPDWVGLELRSPWLEDVTARFVRNHERAAGDDALRPKDWLHLSIAYGIDDLTIAHDATKGFDHRLAATWDIALWRRHPNGRWDRIAPGSG